MDKSLEQIDLSSLNASSRIINFHFDTEKDSLPLQLIAYDEQKGYYITSAAEEFFDNIKTNRLGIVSIVGKSRTGKSYLLNRVLLNNPKGFQVGHSINPCTKGIWIWPSQIEIENHDNIEDRMKIIVMDTEGIGATDQNGNHDSKIFLLVLLLSSYFIYNSIGTIDEKAIQNLSLIVNLSKHLQQNNQKDFEDLLDSFPSFLWVLRDFTLRLIDNNGNMITEKEYLENSLKTQKGFSDNVESKNRIRRTLSQFFKDRDCAMLLRPTESEKDIQNLNIIPPENLRQEFNDQINALRKKVYSRIKAKAFKGEFVNGKTFLALAKLLCKLINQGGVLAIENSWNAVCRNECQKLIEELGNSYEVMFKNEIEKSKLNKQELKQLHQKLKVHITNQFKKRAIGEESLNYEKELHKMLKAKYKYLIKENQRQLEEKMEEIIVTQIFNLKSDINHNKFQTYHEFLDAFKTFQTDLFSTYSNTTQKGLLTELLLNSLVTLIHCYAKINSEKTENKHKYYKEKIKTMQQDIESMKSKHHNEIREYTENFQKVDAERSKLYIKASDFEEKFNNLNEEFNAMRSKLQEKIQELLTQKANQENRYLARIKQLEENLTTIEKTKAESTAEQEKVIAIQSQQIEFQDKEIQNLERKIKDLRKELDDEKTLKDEAIAKVEELSNKLKEVEDNATKMNSTLTESQRRLLSLGCLQERLNEESLKGDKNGLGYELATTTALMEKAQFNETYNETMEKATLEENKKLKANLSQLELYIKDLTTELTLQKKNMEIQMKNIQLDFKNSLQKNDDLIQDLRILALEKADLRCSQMEKKLHKSKIFSQIIKNSLKFQCKVCKEAYTAKIFINHIEKCLENYELPMLELSYKTSPCKSDRVVEEISNDKSNHQQQEHHHHHIATQTTTTTTTTSITNSYLLNKQYNTSITLQNPTLGTSHLEEAEREEPEDPIRTITHLDETNPTSSLASLALANNQDQDQDQDENSLNIQHQVEL